jgi:hypothetical protein
MSSTPITVIFNSSTQYRATCEPIKPAAPVTRTRSPALGDNTGGPDDVVGRPKDLQEDQSKDVEVDELLYDKIETRKMKRKKKPARKKGERLTRVEP